jgi:PAS domain S-box-containing protein
MLDASGLGAGDGAAMPARDEAGRRADDGDDSPAPPGAGAPTDMPDEAPFGPLMADSAQMVWTTSPEGAAEADSPSWRAFTGQTVEQMRGWGWLDAIHPADRARARRMWEQAVASEDSRQMQYRVRRHDGVYRTCSALAAPVRDAGGRIREWVGTCSDVEERAQLLQSERAARERAEIATRRLEALQAVTGIALAHLSLGELVDHLLGHLQEVLAVDNAAILLPTADGRDLTLFSVHGPEEQVAGQVRVPIGQGVAGTIMATGRPLLVDDLSTSQAVNPFLRENLRSLLGVPLMVEDRVTGVLHVATVGPRRFGEEDRSLLELVADRVALAIDRARLYEALGESEQQFRATFEQAAVGIARVGPDWRLLQVNSRLCEITGYTREELLRSTVQDITHPDDLDADLEYARRMLAGEMETYSMEKRYIRKDGSPLWVNLTVALVRAPAVESRYFIYIIQDIAARKRAELEVQQLAATLERRVEERTRQLQEANTEMEAFGYSVSHDLRAPLRAMEGFARALEEDYTDALDPTARMYTRRIAAAAGQMDDLIEDLLTYSRLTRAEIQPQPLSLRSTVTDALRAVEAEASERDALFTVEDMPWWVLGHGATLQQVVTNLVSNAVKFVAPGVRPRVRIWAEPHRQNGQESVHLWVEDNGIGISPEHQERIFRVFERLHGSEEYRGTGIGLAIVRKGVERMGGRAGVESQPGQGSRFWIELPRAEVMP